jgi:putative N6-adenine-specific DNA methylase
MTKPTRLNAFAIVAPGVSAITATELGALGIQPVAVEDAGVTFKATYEELYRANLWLRTASRILVRVGTFHASAFHELERRAKQLSWERFLERGTPVRLRVTCRKSRLYHSDAVAERIAESIEKRAGGRLAKRADTDDEDDDDSAQLFVIRLDHDECTISVDTSGALLHRRGYRLQTAKAPLRETLAAAAIIGSGWDSKSPLIDPMCGSGTIPIEAALLARRIAPGRNRSFAFQRWGSFEEPAWKRLLEEADEGVESDSPPIVASDRDAGAIDAASANAARAGVGSAITFFIQALSAATAPDGVGWLITNAPYGVRLGEEDRLRNLYAQLGKVLKTHFSGWRFGILSAGSRLVRHMGVSSTPVLSTVNGGIPVRFYMGTVDGGDVTDSRSLP